MPVLLKPATRAALLLAGLGLLSALPRTLPAAPAQASPPKRVTLAEFDRLRAQTNHVVLDVRTPREFAAGHVPGAVNLDWNSRNFSTQAGGLDKSRTYLVYCASGNRSARAVGQLRSLGFTNVIEYPGAWREWSASGKPVATQAR
jgi:rhodanese-related sulfurtransferase